MSMRRVIIFRGACRGWRFWFFRRDGIGFRRHVLLLVGRHRGFEWFTHMIGWQRMGGKTL